MTKKRNIWINPFILMGMLLMLTSSCKKDDPVAMVNIPAGTFTMGSPTSEVGRGSDETQFQVTLSAFKMSKYEITNAQYAAFLNAKGIGSDGLYAA
jgi:formylglycine-generating enzyme required for sulfatase activity